MNQTAQLLDLAGADKRFGIGLDQALKYWTVSHLALGESAQLIPGVLQLTRLHNYGAAWSSLSGKTAVLLVITAALMIAVKAQLEVQR